MILLFPDIVMYVAKTSKFVTVTNFTCIICNTPLFRFRYTSNFDSYGFNPKKSKVVIDKSPVQRLQI